MAYALEDESYSVSRSEYLGLKDTTMDRSHAASFTANASVTTTSTLGRISHRDQLKYAAHPPPPPQSPSKHARRNLGASENYSPEKRVDRFIPRVNNGVAISGALAEACGIKTNRVLEFRTAPPKQGLFSDFVSQYTVQKPQRAVQKRHIASSAFKILDAPGIVNDFYLNVLDWSAESNTLAIGLGSAVYSWNANTSEVDVISELENGVSATSLKWADNGAYIAIGLSSGDIQIWDVEHAVKLRTLRGRTERVSVLSWRGNDLSSGGRDGSIWLHDLSVKRHKMSEMTAHAGEVCGLTWRPSDLGVLASGGNDNAVMLWDARIASVPRHALHDHNSAIKALAWCPWQSNLLATGGGSLDQQIHFWNTTTAAKLNTVHTGAQVIGLHWNDDYREIAASMGFPTNSIGVWAYPSLEKQVEISGAHENRILNSTLSPDGQTLVTSSADENIKFWELFATKGKGGSKHGSKNILGSPAFSGMGRV